MMASRTNSPSLYYVLISALPNFLRGAKTMMTRGMPQGILIRRNQGDLFLWCGQ